MKRVPPPQQGFALAETLVAAAIVAVMAAMLFQTLAADTRATAMLRERRRAAMLAGSVLDRAVAGPASVAGDAGRWDGLAWQVGRAPYGAARVDGTVSLERVTVRVRGGDGRLLVALDTLRSVR